ncbi:Holliday junction resolvase RusA (prophage-encoded endonuclease) [Balnearium lithotrophicum]|uniref:Holliday junction resolvase RusA (Prophage-encoded endonuclease) n=1 Tax=Balnearium lithotrophicum TaxID=223788 RepID=A0A521EAV4_9BACT|nr:RusA family crossover junction endodeoxyribonuclease [Balnearium lithotrophicum]SMO81054.1 Holliday junction resolvase RusA (prophage-encoded endonuclease) [Balnearium lithotrophicum]
MKFKFFFVGKIPSKANYKKISHRRVNGEMKPFIVNNPAVLKAQREALWQLHIQKLFYGLEKFPIEKPVKVSLVFFLSGRVKQRDIDNAEKFVGDILEKGGVLKRDSLIYRKENVEKRIGIKGFDEVVYIEIEELKEEERIDHEKGKPNFPEEFYQFLKKMNMELPNEG